MWIFKPVAEGRSGVENIDFVKSELEKLPDSIDSITSLEVGLNFSPSDVAYDMVLISVHPSKSALNDYRQHPKHLEIAEYIGKVTEKRVVVDYEI